MSVKLEPIIIEQIKSIIQKEPKIKSIILFGSRAKGTSQNGSDIDLAVRGDDVGFRDICRLGVQIDELNLPYKVDVVSYNGLKNQDLKEHIDRVGIVL